jgi:hypothetical protein
MSLTKNTLLCATASLALGATLTLRPARATAEEPHGPGWLSVVYHEEITIAASPATIFGVILDLVHYGEWNPWLTHAEGDMVEGGSVEVQVVLNGQTQSADHTVIKVQPDTRFCWKDAGWTTVFAPGQRCRTLTVQPDGKMRFVNELIIDGLLAHLVDLTTGASLRAGMQGENAGLKARAESL